MADITIARYNPRLDKDQLEKLIKDFEWRIGPVDLDKVIKEIDIRTKDLKFRNSMILAKEGDTIVGAGFFSLWNDYLGNQMCYIHDVVTRKEDSFKKGIEELILREIFVYLKKTLKIEKINFFTRKKGDGTYQALLLKLGIRPSDLDFYEGTL